MGYDESILDKESFSFWVSGFILFYDFCIYHARFTEFIFIRGLGVLFTNSAYGSFMLADISVAACV